MDQVTEARASDPLELPGLADLLHDRHFDIEELTVDPSARQLRLPLYDRRPNVGWFGRLLGRRPPRSTHVLTIGHVVDHFIDDQAGVRWFDIDGLYAVASGSDLVLRSNLPFELAVAVDDVDVSVALATSEPET